jgi:CRISPR-associated protein (Cas_Csd1)
MGPTLSLVKLAVRRGLHPFIEEIEATDKKPLMRLDIQPGGEATCKRLKTGSKARAMRTWSRTGKSVVPRAFRDNAEYNLDKGPRREGYAALVQRMLDNHPRSKPLQALHAFLTRKRSAPKSWYVEDAEYVPYYSNRPILLSVERDYDDESMDPYGDGPFDGRVQPDVITGERCIVPNRRPIRIRGIGTGTGVTLISVEDKVTASHWWSNPKLQAPMSERTMNLSTAALQGLVRRGGYTAAWKEGAEDVLRYYAWTQKDSSMSDMVMDVLMGKATLDKVESWAKKCANSKDNLCVIGLYGGKRLIIFGWHHIPLAEAAESVLAYARNNNWKHDGNTKVLGMARTCALTLPYNRCVQDDTYNPKLARKICNSKLAWQMHAALVDHIVDGDIFPMALRDSIRHAVLTQKISDARMFRAHVRDQLTILDQEKAA